MTDKPERIDITPKGVAFIHEEARLRGMSVDELIDSGKDKLARDALGDISSTLAVLLAIASIPPDPVE